MDRRFRGEKVYDERRDTGQMFDSTLSVRHDPSQTLPYFAFVSDGWGGGVGRSYATLQEAKDNLERLFTRLYGG